MDKDNSPKMGPIGIVMLPVLAIMGDLIGLIPTFKDFLEFVVWGAVAIYFKSIGMGWINGKKLAVAAVSMVMAFIPGVQELPELTAGVVAVIIMTVFEQKVKEKTGLSLGSLAKGDIKGAVNQGNVRQPTGRPEPLNNGKVRLPNGGLGNSGLETSGQ